MAFKNVLKPQNSAMYTYSPSYTFPGNLPEEVFVRPTIGTPPITDFFQLRQGIRTKEVLLLLTEISKVIKPSTGCTPTYAAAGSFSDRTITVAEFDIAQQWCKSDWQSTASVITNDPKWMANGLDGFQLTKTLSNYLVGSLLDAARRDLWRMLFFSNTNAGSGNTDYGAIDGVFKLLEDGNASYCVKTVGYDLPDDPNAVLGDGIAYNALKATHVGAPIVLKQLPASEKVFWVNGGMYENLLASYESKTNGATELQFKLILDGTDFGAQVGDGQGGVVKQTSGLLTYRGIPVIPLYFADDAMADTNNPYYKNIANFIIYTTRGSSRYGNHVIGTENAADLNRIDLYYDQRLRTMFLQGNMRFGYNFINCNLTALYR